MSFQPLGNASDVFTEESLYKHWASESRINYLGQSYRVGKMSYNQYFLEPGKDRGEMSDFNEGTLWLELVDPKHGIYAIEQELV